MSALDIVAAAALPDICDAAGDGIQVTTEFFATWVGAHLIGPAFTVAGVAGDNLALHQALYHCPSGAVLVASVGGHIACAHWGGLLAFAAQQKGVQGILIDGAVRDVHEFEQQQFPVFARAVHPQKAARQQLGQLNLPIQCGSLLIHPGDIVVADAHGVGVFPAAELERVARSLETARTQEREIIRRLESGEPYAAITGLTFDPLEAEVS